MNYHRYGEKYGFHVDQLECNFGIPDDTLHPDQWMCFKLSATIVDDELLVMLDYSSLFYLDQPDSLKAAEEKIRGPHHSLCASHGFQHLRNWTEEYFVKAYRCRKCSNEGKARQEEPCGVIWDAVLIQMIESGVWQLWQSPQDVDMVRHHCGSQYMRTSLTIDHLEKRLSNYLGRYMNIFVQDGDFPLFHVARFEKISSK
ncbi:hypothetical protein LOZ12_003383 [Ophidiomyces ophidiicola]|uniref:Uncharacterized protein n=1 Tax=Ophidiomyces ophidiicola TaxID=1387563 RepID=A0ACB8UMF3_9EURO|nr:hypothetical protein LOZ62_003320 [Ophidiomyces ophidiicola]KAI1972876.1 hypothetical protein LOZ56_002223 [Ophidiomyces ophidiicola]KAI2050591.1 hypothetical protein LOZ38_003237 [Ophidiomyces ophidiicola]KAI2082566.1 hypothetical protein LOZ36_005895 [Ophidiomyces ophidiicola]KAI2099843.1 hypothetical protein LOZ35_001259 [Ophidiomyces ophidiicola]